MNAGQERPERKNQAISQGNSGQFGLRRLKGALSSLIHQSWPDYGGKGVSGESEGYSGRGTKKNDGGGIFMEKGPRRGGLSRLRQGKEWGGSLYLERSRVLKKGPNEKYCQSGATTLGFQGG